MSPTASIKRPASRGLRPGAPSGAPFLLPFCCHFVAICVLSLVSCLITQDGRTPVGAFLSPWREARGFPSQDPRTGLGSRHGLAFKRTEAIDPKRHFGAALRPGPGRIVTQITGFGVRPIPIYKLLLLLFIYMGDREKILVRKVVLVQE